MRFLNWPLSAGNILVILVTLTWSKIIIKPQKMYHYITLNSLQRFILPMNLLEFYQIPNLVLIATKAA